MIPKIKRTKNGNIQITITEGQANAVRDLFGFTSFDGRSKLCKKYDYLWLKEDDENYRVVYNLINNHLG